jgi:hypothetical protein
MDRSDQEKKAQAFREKVLHNARISLVLIPTIIHQHSQLLETFPRNQIIDSKNRKAENGKKTKAITHFPLKLAFSFKSRHP